MRFPIQLFSKILTAGLALIIFVGLFFFENHFSRSEALEHFTLATVSLPDGQIIELQRGEQTEKLQGPQEFQFLEGDTVNTLQSPFTEIHFGEHGVIRLAASSLFRFASLDEQNHGFSFQLLQGRAWVNHLLSPGPLNILAGNAYVLSESAVFDLVYDASKTVLYSHRRHVLVGLVPSNYVPGPILSVPAVDFLNSYLLVEGNQTTVFNDKVEQNREILKKLLYSKLIKEFQYGFFDLPVLKTQSWVLQNLKEDQDFFQSIVTEELKKIRAKGLIFSDLNAFQFQLRQSTNRLTDSLTFDSQKVITRKLNNFFDQLSDAQYLIIFGRLPEARERLAYFKNLIGESDASVDDDFRQALLERLEDAYTSLAFVIPSDPLFEIKTTLSDLMMVYYGHSDFELQRKFLLVRDYLDGVSDLAETNPQAARLVFDQYQKHFGDFLNKEKNRLVRVKAFFAQENQLVENLFRQYALFYSDNFFAFKNRLEQEWLALLPDLNERNEEKQTLVGVKIDFLQKLKEFFLVDKIATEEARKIVFRLFREADDLQLPVDAQVAVGELFAKRLEDFGVFFRYLNSPEFVGSTVHGATHREQFEQFLQFQKPKVTINEVREEILGKDVPDITPTPSPVVSPEIQTQETVSPTPPSSGVCRKCVKPSETQEG